MRCGNLHESSAASRRGPAARQRQSSTVWHAFGCIEGVTIIGHAVRTGLWLGTALAATAYAQTTPPVDAGPADAPRRELRHQIGASINNAGLHDTLEISWQRPVTASTHPLRSGAHLSAGVVNVLTPSMDRVGAWVEYAPLSVVSLRVGAEPSGYFGTFHSVLAFQGYDEPFDAEIRDARGAGRAATGVRSYVTPAVQFRAGPVAFRTTADIEWWKVNVSGPWYYEPARDTLLHARGDWLVNATTVALYQRDRAAGGFTAGGVLHHVMQVFEAPDNRIQRLGVIAMHELASPHFGLPHLRATVTAWRYLDDPSKRHEWGAAVAVGFRFGLAGGAPVR